MKSNDMTFSKFQVESQAVVIIQMFSKFVQKRRNHASVRNMNHTLIHIVENLANFVILKRKVSMQSCLSYIQANR